MIRDLVSYPCEDACGTLTTDRTILGAPVYRCPGCDSQWYDERERTETQPDAQRPEPSGGEATNAPVPSS